MILSPGTVVRLLIPDYQVITPKTAVANGYTNPREDTVDIAPLVEYWQHNPNYGMEMGLSSYSHPTYASRSQKSLANDLSYLEFSFKVKSVAATYNQATGLGDITVNAPSGTLPYTYLISYDSIQPLDSIWNNIKDSTLIDSTFFLKEKIIPGLIHFPAWSVKSTLSLYLTIMV